MDDAALLALAAELADRAGEAILAIRAAGFETLSKSDDSPVTEADRQAERIIARGLRGALPGALVVAEEECSDGRLPSAAREFWLVDPLDGTREFATGRPEFTVNIAFVRDGEPVLGVVLAPAFGEFFSGGRGLGAWKRTAAGRQAIRVRKAPAEGLSVVTSRHSGRDPRVDAWVAQRRVASHLQYGSSLKLCRLAEGDADAYPRFGRTMEWDTAAGQAVLEAAGGSVRSMHGERLGYGKPGWENPDFLAEGA
jgi:3'(2'), 5'-bisphosphate nucleotidase